MNLTIDIGNTTSKYAIFNKSQIIEVGIIPSSLKTFFEQLFGIHKITNIIVASVGVPLSNEIIALFSANRSILLEFNQTTPLPFTNLYKTPHTIGLDRLAAVAGAVILYPNENLLIIDAGTAITYDFVNSKNEYLGGNISLGINMRFKALNTFTKRLPLIEPSLEFSLVGETTVDAIKNGVLNGVVHEVDGLISEGEVKFSNLRVVFTGGDTYFFDAKLKSRIFAHANLVLEGLNSILEYNAK